MGCHVLHDDARWLALLHQGQGNIVPGAAMHYATTPSFGHYQRCIDQHICNYITSGTLVVTVGDRRYAIPAGSAIWVNAGVTHDFALNEASQPFTMLNVRFHAHDGEMPIGFNGDVLICHDALDLRPLWELQIDDRQRQHRDAGIRARHALALLYSDFRLRQADAELIGGLGRPRRSQLTNWVSTRLHLRPSAQDMAAVVGLSLDYFRRAFQRSFHTSPRTWLVRERIRRAAHLLTDDPQCSVHEVAEALGYHDYRLFDRQFHQVIGTTPTAWRQR